MEQSRECLKTKNVFGTKFSILGCFAAEICIVLLVHPHYLDITGCNGNEYALC